MLLELLAHANTVVGDRVFIDGDAIRWLHLAAHQANIAALAVVLNGIAGNIEQQALEMRHAHPRIGMIKRLLVADNCHQTLLGLTLQNIAHFTVEGHQIYGHEVQVDLPALQATHIECLVGKVEQQSRCRPDFRAALGLLLQIVRIGIANLDHAANAVDGCAQVMAHATQKLRLCRVGRRGLTRRLCQLVAIVALLLQQVRQTSTISAATHRHNNGYNTAVERQHAGSNSRDNLKVTPRRGIGVHIEFVRFSKCAQIPLAVGVNQSDLTSQASILNTVDNEDVRRRQIEYAQYGGFNGIGRNDLAVAFDHDIAAIDGFIAIKQALQFERIACNRLRALMPYRDNDALAILPSHAANVCDRIIRKRDAGGIGLKRMSCHLQHG